jgi:hypothetical protein
MPTGTPILKGKTATPVPDFIDFSSDGQIGWIMLVNKGTESIWIAFDALPAGVTTGDGRMELKPTQRLILSGISIIAVGIRTAAGPADIEAAALT